MIDQKLFCNTYFDLQETKNDQAKGTNRKKLVPCFLFWGKFNFYTTWVEVKSRLLCKLRRSVFLTSTQLVSKLAF